MAEKKFFVDINLQGNKLVNPVVGSNSSMTTAGSFQYNAGRLEYYNGSTVEEVANLNDIAAVTGGLIFQGGYNAVNDTPHITSGLAQKGFFLVVTVAGTFLGESVQVGDSIVAKEDAAGLNPDAWLILQGNVVIATDSVDGIVRLATQTEANDGTEGGAVVITPATLQGKIDAQITPEINNKLPLAGGTMSGNINMGGNEISNISYTETTQLGANSINTKSGETVNFIANYLDFQNQGKVTNLPAPTDGGDATNKTYVDNNTSNKLPLAGGTMSGTIDMGGFNIEEADVIEANRVIVLAPANGSDAANKTYVDDQDALKVSKAGDTMSGNLDMGANQITNADSVQTNYLNTDNLGGNTTEINLLTNIISNGQKTIQNLPAPTNGGDATNKTYVDNAASTAESNANDYTDTEIAATRYSANIQTTDWTVFGGDPANGYIATITHNLNCYYPVIQLNDDNTGYAVEMATQYNNLNETNIFSNFIPSGLIVATLIKAAV